MKDEQTIRYKVVLDAPDEILELINAYDDYIDRLAYELHENEVVYGCESRNDDATKLAFDRIQRAKDAILPRVDIKQAEDAHGFPKEIASAYINGQKWALPKMLWYSFLYGASRTFDNSYLPTLGYGLFLGFVLSGYVLEQDETYFLATIAYLFMHTVFHASSVFHKRYSEPKKSLY